MLHLPCDPASIFNALLRIIIFPVSVIFFLIMLPRNIQVPPKVYILYLGGCHFYENFLQNKGLKLMLKMNSQT